MGESYPKFNRPTWRLSCWVKATVEIQETATVSWYAGTCHLAFGENIGPQKQLSNKPTRSMIGEFNLFIWAARSISQSQYPVQVSSWWKANFERGNSCPFYFLRKMKGLVNRQLFIIIKYHIPIGWFSWNHQPVEKRQPSAWIRLRNHQK